MYSMELEYQARNLLTGRFLKGHKPHNRGKKMEEYMSPAKIRKVKRVGMRNLKGRSDIGGWNKRQVLALLDDGSYFLFSSATKAAEMTHLERRNITRCCQKKCKHCGSFRWFYWDDDEWIKIVRNNEQV